MTTKNTTPAVTKTEPTTAADEAAKKREDAATSAPEKAKAVERKGDLSVAVNLITMTGDDGKPVEVMPGTVFEPAAIDVDFLKLHGAIRAPEDGEKALYEQAQRLQAAAATADDTLG